MANDVDQRPEADSPDVDQPNSDVVAFGFASDDVVPIVAAAAGAAAALSGQQPTGNAVADIVLPFAFAAGVVWLAPRATSKALLASPLLALFFTGLQLPSALIAVAALASAVLITSWRRFDRDSREIGAAMTAGFVVHAALNLPNIRFVGTASLLAAIAVAPIVVSGYRKLAATERRRIRRGALAVLLVGVLATVLLGIAALGVRDHVETGIEQAEDGINALQQGDQPEARALLDASRENFEIASNRLGGPLSWPARFVPIVAQHARALETASDQGVALTETAARTVEQADVEKIRGINGEIDIAVIDAVNAELTAANLTLQGARQSLLAVDTPWIVPQLSSRLDSVQVELAEAQLDIDLANHGTAVLPGILGAEGQRRYLVLFMQPAESRSLGGFVGAYGILEANQGRFNLIESGSVDKDLGSGDATFADVSLYPEPYVQVAPHINPQNLTATPDLSTVAAAAREFVPQLRSNPLFTIDGVITLDPYALAGILELTGPVAVEGRDEPIDASNVVNFLLREQYLEFDQSERDERQDVLQRLAGDAFSELFSIEIPGPERLGSIFGPVARANRLSFVTFEETENAFLDRIFLSADLPQVGSAVEMLGVFGQTGVASKLDAYSTRSISYEVLVDPATGMVTGDLEIVERNGAPADAPEFVLGLTSPDFEGNDLVDGTNVVAYGVYTRGALTDVDADVVFRTSENLPALGYDRYPIFVEIPLGESATITMKTASQVEPGRYDLFLPAQPTAVLSQFTLVVRPTAGWKIIDQPVAEDGSYSTTFEMDQARGLTFNFEPIAE